MVLICYYWLVGVFRFRWGIYDDDSVAPCVSGIQCTGRQPGAAAHRHQQRQPGSLAAAWQQLGGCHLASLGMAVALWLWPVAQGAKRSSGRAKVKF